MAAAEVTTTVGLTTTPPTIAESTTATTLALTSPTTTVQITTVPTTTAPATTTAVKTMEPPTTASTEIVSFNTTHGVMQTPAAVVDGFEVSTYVLIVVVLVLLAIMAALMFYTRIWERWLKKRNSRWDPESVDRQLPSSMELDPTSRDRGDHSQTHNKSLVAEEIYLDPDTTEKRARTSSGEDLYLEPDNGGLKRPEAAAHPKHESNDEEEYVDMTVKMSDDGHGFENKTFEVHPSIAEPEEIYLNDLPYRGSLLPTTKPASRNNNTAATLAVSGEQSPLTEEESLYDNM